MLRFAGRAKIGEGVLAFGGDPDSFSSLADDAKDVAPLVLNERVESACFFGGGLEHAPVCGRDSRIVYNACERTHGVVCGYASG